ncbi:MAG: D-glycero-beta-D-manno-heptose 1,7-bisphosphate 7-phosphatase [Burkholderiaceae bacterium]|jgi:D-glycero-D-manno-heptose 1,7-bisphosphate phosphatase|nr:D-glycero-beta-D-manno-heptose 1,7-bisphosphate 7-phosphatase [Burkholderiaceae bacterium]
MKLVIVDRDGTLNADRPEHVQTPEQWEPLPGALDAIARLNHAGYHVVIVANLPGLERGLYDMDALNATHARLHRELAALGGRVEAIFFCPHTPEEGCDCRKPKPGLFLQIGARFKVDLKRVHAVGDSERDLQAAVAAGCAPHLVLTGQTRLTPGQALPPAFPPGTRVHADLAAFATDFLAGQKNATANAAPPAPGA